MKFRELFAKFSSVLLLSVALHAYAGSRFKVEKATLPEDISAGQEISLTFDVLAVELDEPFYYRPEAHIRWQNSGIAQSSSAEKTSPWQVGAIKNGDRFSVTITMLVDPNVQGGDTGIGEFGLWRLLDGQYIWNDMGAGSNMFNFQLACGGKKGMTLPAAVQELFPQVTVPAMKTPEIDGRISDGEWDAAAETADFVSSRDGAAYSPRTTVRVGYGEGQLFVLFRTEEKEGYEA